MNPPPPNPTMRLTKLGHVAEKAVVSMLDNYGHADYQYGFARGRAVPDRELSRPSAGPRFRIETEAPVPSLRIELMWDRLDTPTLLEEGPTAAPPALLDRPATPLFARHPDEEEDVVDEDEFEDDEDEGDEDEGADDYDDEDLDEDELDEDDDDLDDEDLSDLDDLELDDDEEDDEEEDDDLDDDDFDDEDEEVDDDDDV